MPSKIIDAYRQQLAAQGLTDPRDDYFVASDLGPIVQTEAPQLFDKDPGLGELWSEIRDANAPSMAGEFGRAFKGGLQGLASTALGGASLLTGSDYLRQKAASFDQDAAENAPTIPTLEDIAPGRTGASKYFSRDAARYAISKLGQVAPSIAEAGVTALAGAAAGSAVAPGPGTVGGAAEGLIARSFIKSAIRSLVKKKTAEALVEKGLLKEASELGLEQALRSGSKEVADVVGREAMAIGARRGLGAANLANSYLLNAGDVYSEGADRPTTLALGLVSAIPDSALPTYVLGRLFPGVAAKEAKDLGKLYLADRAKKVLEAAGVVAGEGATEYFQEGVNVVARNLKEGKDPLTFTDADLRRFREAGIAGAAGGGLAAPGLFLEGSRGELPAARPEQAPPAAAPAAPIAPVAPVAPEPVGRSSIIREINALSDDEKRARLADLASRPRSADEETAFQILQATVPAATAQAPVLEPQAVTTEQAPVTAQPPVEPAPAAVEAAPGAPVVEDPGALKQRQLADAVRTPGVTYQYSVFRPGQGIPDAVQIDVIAPDKSQSLASTSPEALRAAGIDIPDVPASLPQGRYTLEQVREAAQPAAPVVNPEPVEAVISQPTAEPVAHVPFEQGAVIEGNPSTDFRTEARFAKLNSQQWMQALNQIYEENPTSDKSGNRSQTRLGVALRGPDGRVILAGLTVPQRTLNSSGTVSIKEPAIQRMGVSKNNKAGVAARIVETGGNFPAVVQDVVDAGYQPIAVVHFSGAPAKIYQTFANEQAFDRSWASTEKTQGKQIRPPAMTAQPAIARQREAELTREIDTLGNEFLRAKDEVERNEIRSEIQQKYAELERITGREQAQTGELPLDEGAQMRRSLQNTVQTASRASEFQAVAANLRNLGMRVDVFAKEFFQQGAAEPLQQQIEQLKAQLATAQGSAAADIQAKIAQREARIQELQQAAGVAYSPYHVAISLDDVSKADVGNLVTLLHEAAESLTMRLNPTMKGLVLRAVDESMTDVRNRAIEASTQTGVPVSETVSASDLLAESLAQKLAAAGVDGSQSLAQAIVRWVKDLYYRVVMSAQRAFGGEPDAKLAMDWFENQLRRETGGDFDYRLADVLDRFTPLSPAKRVEAFTGARETPGGVADFLDPTTNKMSQPAVDPTSTSALDWNIEFRQGDTGDENIPDREARARMDAAALNDIKTFAESLHQQVAPEMPFAEFWKLAGRGEDPNLLLADIDRRVQGAATAQVGGEKMTKPMNQQALLTARILTEKIHLRQLRELAKSRQQIDTSSDTLVDNAKEINRMESDVRNAAMHEDSLRDKFREMSRELVRAMHRGTETAHLHGRLAEAIRQAEGLMDNEAIPEEYQKLLKAATEGTQPLFDSVRAVAQLDLPLTDMSNAEVVAAIRENAELNPELRSLANNKPLAVAVAELVRSNIEQTDQIQLGWLRDTTRFREIYQELDKIRNATKDQVDNMVRGMDERAKAKGLLERLKVGYLKRRRALRNAQDRIDTAEARATTLEKAIPITAARATELQQQGAGARSEWFPVEGAEFTAMQSGDEGWTSAKRTLRFNPDGSAVDSDQIKRDISANMDWLRANESRKGQALYERIKRQTYELAMLDVQRKYPAGWANLLERMVQPIGAEARTAGHSSGARIAQMLQQFDFIIRSHRDEASASSGWWTRALKDVEEAAGIKDHGQFFSQVYDPVMYFLNVNPGLDEQHAIREATRLARRLIPGDVPENFNEKFVNFLRRTKEASEQMVKLAEQYGVYVKDPRLRGELRSAIDQGWLTTPRSLRADVVQTLVRDMQKAGWKLELKQEASPEGTPRPSVVRATTFDSLAPEDFNPQNSEVLRKVLGNYFTPDVVNRWLVPFINKPGTEIFNWRGDAIPQLEVQQAWEKSGGDVLKFIDNLADGRQLVVDEETGADPLATFRQSILKQMDSLFGMESKLAYESAAVRDVFDPMGPRPHAMMDARLNDLLPPEHVQFQSFDPVASHRLLGLLAFHGAFGRNGTRMIQTVNELKGVLQARKAEFDSLQGTTRGARAAEAAARGLDYKQLEASAENYQRVVDMQSKIRGLFGVGNSAGPFHDLRGGLEVMNAMAGQIVDQPKVGFYNLLSMAMRPFAMRSLGPMTTGTTVRAYANMLGTTMGSFLENLNMHMFRASDYAKDVGSVEGQAFRTLPWGTVLADIGHRGKFQTSKTDKFLIQPLRALRAIQRKGVRVGIGEGAREFPRLAAIPGLGVLNSMSQMAAQANSVAQVQMFENVVRKGIDYFNAHPTDLHDPTFRFDSKKLRISGLDQGVFDYLRNKTVEYGMGNLEDIVRQSATAAAAGERLITRDQVLRLAQMAANELDGASSINTTPSILQTNPLLKIGMPLLRWPLWMMHTVHEGLNTAEGQRSLKAMAKGLGTLAMWNLPVGIAFSLMLDQYDEKLLHKKSNQRPIDSLAAIPIVGPAAAIAAGSRGWDNAMAMLERGARAGNIYGLGADLASQMVAPYDPNSGQRAFSMDQRILVMSQFLNFQQAIRNLVSQGGDTTWASFWRPAMMAIGGNGVLHSVDITNNLLDLDNAESRLVQRINAQNWLRSAGREVGLELRSAGGSSTAPTPMSVWTREMQLAAMANDRLGFLDAYRKALNAARDQVGDDPRVAPTDREKEAQNRVLSSWASRDPMEVFRFKPSTAQVSQLYSVMDEDGRQDVQDALVRYKNFTQLIKPSGISRYLNQQTSRDTKASTMMRQRGASFLLQTTQ